MSARKAETDQVAELASGPFPPDFDPERKYPMILEIHGGPFANYGDRFSAEVQDHLQQLFFLGHAVQRVLDPGG